MGVGGKSGNRHIFLNNVPDYRTTEGGFIIRKNGKLKRVSKVDGAVKNGNPSDFSGKDPVSVALFRSSREPQKQTIIRIQEMVILLTAYGQPFVLSKARLQEV